MGQTGEDVRDLNRWRNGLMASSRHRRRRLAAARSWGASRHRRVKVKDDALSVLDPLWIPKADRDIRIRLVRRCPGLGWDGIMK